MRSKTIADLPECLLQSILENCLGSQQLKTRASLACCNKAFASLVRQQQSLVFTSANLIGSGPNFSPAGLLKLQPVLHNIMALELMSVSSDDVYRMADVARCCPALSTVVLHFKENSISCWQEAPVVKRFWNSLDTKHRPFKQIRAQLQQVLITSSIRVLLHVDATEGTQDPDNSLACVTAGSLKVLSALAAADPDELQGVNQTARNNLEQADAAMLALMPALKWLDIADMPLHAPFHGTVRGRLSQRTVETFRQASVAHCTGLGGDVWNIWQPHHICPVDSILSWTSRPEKYGWMESSLLAQLAPRLETLHIEIALDVGPGPLIISLGPALKCVDVLVGPRTATLVLKGWPSNDLVHMRIECATIDSSTVRMQRKLFKWLQAKQAQRLLCAEFAALKANEGEEIVCVQKLQADGGPDSVAILILQFDSPMK